MAENAVLVAFGVLPILLGATLYRLSRPGRPARKGRLRLRLVTANVTLLLLLCSVVVVLGEVYYRFFYDTTDSFGLTKVTQRWFDRYYHFNASGLRDSIDGYEQELPSGKRRVSFVGDSFTAGHGVPDVEERFANRIRHAHRDWEVHVFSMNGWDTGDELTNVKSLTKAGYQFDRLILVYTLNDIADIVPEWQQILERIYESSEPGFLVAHSFFFNTLYYRRKATRDPEVARYYPFVRRAYEGPLWEEQKARLAGLRSAVESGGGRLLVVTFPFLHTLGPDYEFREIHERLDAFWRSLGVAHLDLLEPYESRAGEDLVVNEHDAHPNERAHQLAAHAIGAFVERSLVDRP